MFPDDKIIEIFSICDDFSKVFDKTLEQNSITACDSSKKRKYHRNGMMSDSEAMTILILSHDSGYRCLKHSCLQYVCKYMRHLFPKTVSYNQFGELERRAVVKLAILVKSVLMGKCTGISFIDTKLKNKMKNSLMSISDKVLLRKRAIIETINDGLKNMAQWIYVNVL